MCGEVTLNHKGRGPSCVDWKRAFYVEGRGGINTGKWEHAWWWSEEACVCGAKWARGWECVKHLLLSSQFLGTMVRHGCQDFPWSYLWFNEYLLFFAQRPFPLLETIPQFPFGQRSPLARFWSFPTLALALLGLAHQQTLSLWSQWPVQGWAYGPRQSCKRKHSGLCWIYIQKVRTLSTFEDKTHDCITELTGVQRKGETELRLHYLSHWI